MAFLVLLWILKIETSLSPSDISYHSLKLSRKSSYWDESTGSLQSQTGFQGVPSLLKSRQALFGRGSMGLDMYLLQIPRNLQGNVKMVTDSRSKILKIHRPEDHGSTRTLELHDRQNEKTFV